MECLCVNSVCSTDDAVHYLIQVVDDQPQANSNVTIPDRNFKLYNMVKLKVNIKLKS